MSRRLIAVLGLLSLSSLVSSCSQTRVVSANRTIDIVLTEYRLEPQRVLTRTRQLTIVVHNYGRLTHNFVLQRGGQAAARTDPIPPGRTATLTLTLGRGTYVMASTILSDTALGTYGTLVVQ